MHLPIRKVLIGLLVGVALTVLCGLIAGLGGGACHCSTPLAVLFPYAAIAFDAFSWESIGGWLMMIQFPLYSVTIATVRGDKRKGWIVFILLAAHAVAASIGLRVSH